MSDVVATAQPVLTSRDFKEMATWPIEKLRDFIGFVEGELRKYPQIDIPVKHHFSKGVYAREMGLARDILVIGKIHRHHTMNVISSGEVTVISQDGIQRIKAPYTFVSTPGAKRIIYAHKDAIWTTFHGTEETDLEKIENEFIAKTYEDVVMVDGEKVLEIREVK